MTRRIYHREPRLFNNGLRMAVIAESLTRAAYWRLRAQACPVQELRASSKQLARMSLRHARVMRTGKREAVS